MLFMKAFCSIFEVVAVSSFHEKKPAGPKLPYNTCNVGLNLLHAGSSTQLCFGRNTRKDNQPNSISHCCHFTWISASKQHATAPPGQHLIAQKRGNNGFTGAAFPSLLQAISVGKKQSLAMQADTLQNYLPQLCLATCLYPSSLRNPLPYSRNEDFFQAHLLKFVWC